MLAASLVAATMRRESRWITDDDRAGHRARRRAASPGARATRRRARARAGAPACRRPRRSPPRSAPSWRRRCDTTAFGLDRLAFQDDHAQIALVELAAPLHRLHQLLVVQVAFAEIPADQRPGDGLTLTQRVVRLVVQRAGNSPLSARPWTCMARKARALSRSSRRLPGRTAERVVWRSAPSFSRPWPRSCLRRRRGSTTRWTPSCRRSNAMRARTKSVAEHVSHNRDHGKRNQQHCQQQR